MIDWAKVLELRDEIGADDFGEVVELFIEEVDGAVDEIRASRPTDTMESALHFLKGSALNLGFRAFATLCQAGETAAGAGEHAGVNVDEILACYEASKVGFLAELEDRMAA